MNNVLVPVQQLITKLQNRVESLECENKQLKDAAQLVVDSAGFKCSIVGLENTLKAITNK